MINNWEIARWVSSVPHPYSEADGREWIARVQQDHAADHPRRFAIALQDTDRPIGSVGLAGSTGNKSEEPALGYWLGEPYWGRGYAREAVAAVLDYGLRILGLATIRAYTGPAIWLRKRFCCTAVSKKSAKSSSSSRPVMAPGTPLCSASRNRRWHDKRANLVAELR